MIGLSALAIGLVFGWLTTSRKDKSNEDPRPGISTSPMLPASITSPAAQSTVECAHLGILDEQSLLVNKLVSALGPYVPTYVPEGAGFVRTWRGGRGEPGPGAQWATEECRTVTVRFYPMKWDRQRDWHTRLNDECAASRLGRTSCIVVRAHVPDGFIDVSTTGYTKEEAFRVARSIEL
jgi:hypothetical protein